LFYKQHSLLDPQNREVGQKLGIATLLMFTLPIITYYVSERYFADKQHPDNWAALSAIVMTNIIVGGYCYAAYVEDSEEKALEEKTKGVPPRVGIYKERTD
jgi:uncharacterized membrane protein